MDKWEREELDAAIRRIDEWMIWSQTNREEKYKRTTVLVFSQRNDRNFGHMWYYTLVSQISSFITGVCVCEREREREKYSYQSVLVGDLSVCFVTQFQFEVGLLIAVTLSSLVCLSRLYTGMHSVLVSKSHTHTHTHTHTHCMKHSSSVQDSLFISGSV